MTAAASAGSMLPRLDKYELLEEIGHGGMATVYRARDPRLGREVAVKLIHRHLRENAEVGARFVAEARAAAKLRHPGIVDVFDVSPEDDPERYLVAELLRGTTLRKVLLAHRDMPAEIGAAIVAQLCEAVEHAHAAAIIHRDIKPENVLVELPGDRGDTDATPTPAACDSVRPRSSPKGPGVVIKITDFGIAKILDAQGVTSTGQVLGSPAHMAPEQIEGGDVDARTDVFALGVLLYECLAGHLPFEGKNPAQVLRRVLDGIFSPVDQDRPSAGARWAKIVAEALAHDPGARIASAAELGERIRAELEAVGAPDGKAEIAAYFADPADYVDAHKARLVPRLIARGEAARKAGDVWGAAADYNRALALAPDDLAILKRIAGLNASAGRRLLARRVALIVAGSAALGLGAFVVTRTVRAFLAVTPPFADAGAPLDGTLLSPRTESPVIIADTPPRPVTSASPPPVPPVEPTGPHDTVARTSRIPANPTFTLAPLPVPATRLVRFMVNPKGAKLFVDDKEHAWYRSAVALSIGDHRVVAIPNDPGCCKKTEMTVSVKAPPPERPDEEQPSYVQLEIIPAGVTLVGRAPKGAQMSCADIGLVVPAGSTVMARLRGPEWEGTCAFRAPSLPPHVSQVHLKAGQSITVPWPE
jgi:serine/threonine-protein kinase